MIENRHVLKKLATEENITKAKSPNYPRKTLYAPQQHARPYRITTPFGLISKPLCLKKQAD